MLPTESPSVLLTCPTKVSLYCFDSFPLGKAYAVLKHFLQSEPIMQICIRGWHTCSKPLFQGSTSSHGFRIVWLWQMMKIQLCSYMLFEANLCWPFTSLVLLAPFVWLMSECDALPIVPPSEPHALSTLPLSNSHEVMS